MMEKRTKIIKIRATESEYLDLVSRSQKPKLAEWMREFCLDAKVPKAKKIPPVDPNLLRQLAGMGNNLNQIARAVNSQEWKPTDKIQIITALVNIQRELAELKTEHTHDS